MASQEDIAMGDTPNPRLREPFTVEENILQLNAIDKSMVQLMHHTATALSALTTPSSSRSHPSTTSSASASASALAVPEDAAAAAAAGDETPSSSVNPEAQKDAFRIATDTFLSTLHNIDVRMKRQILALEEAGIVDLSNAQRQEPGAASRASLRPNGLGTVGNLDVGWLNSRGTKVERDMELELWEKAKGLLEQELKTVKSDQ
ncbi:hypothetical protein ESCO_006431 [Escovopsis weberi]|uniref:Mediator of RNA polymerase II transcription subunit 11 n=1 Tax=Escovopsis weberi TaxID=150374 RepID=A0A0M8N0B6_ESCWE|nr:hypothetical protein ESCO_006431 [Escovopsis weberi]